MNYSYTIQESRYGLFTSVFADGTKGTTALTKALMANFDRLVVGEGL